VALALGLVERIGARVPASRLVSEVGPEAARQLAASRLWVLAGVRELCSLIPALAETAASASVPIVLLKFAALHVGGYLAEGSRAAGDVDVLVREGDAERLAGVLIARGFWTAQATSADHHRPPLRDGLGRVVELHTRLPGLRRPGGRRFCGFDELASAGALDPAPGLAEGCHLLRRDPLAAHAIAHGLAHHGGADAYPLMRMLADVIDILGDDCRGRGARAREWLDDDVRPADLESALALGDALRAGRLDDLLAAPASQGEGALLRHVLASALDADYRASLVVRHFVHPLTDERRWRKLWTMVRYSVFPSDAQLAARFGLPSTHPIDRRLRLAHARRLPRRLVELARSAVRVARRRMSRAKPAASRAG